MEKSPKISVFWAKIKKNFHTRGLISLTKYWNSVTVGSPVITVRAILLNHKKGQIPLNVFCDFMYINWLVGLFSIFWSDLFYLVNQDTADCTLWATFTLLGV